MTEWSKILKVGHTEGYFLKNEILILIVSIETSASMKTRRLKGVVEEKQVLPGKIETSLNVDAQMQAK